MYICVCVCKTRIWLLMYNDDFTKYHIDHLDRFITVPFFSPRHTRLNPFALGSIAQGFTVLQRKAVQTIIQCDVAYIVKKAAVIY